MTAVGLSIKSNWSLHQCNGQLLIPTPVQWTAADPHTSPMDRCWSPHQCYGQLLIPTLVQWTAADPHTIAVDSCWSPHQCSGQMLIPTPVHNCLQLLSPHQSNCCRQVLIFTPVQQVDNCWSLHLSHNCRQVLIPTPVQQLYTAAGPCSSSNTTVDSCGSLVSSRPFSIKCFKLCPLITTVELYTFFSICSFIDHNQISRSQKSWKDEPTT